jgi:hypothetical protein
MADNKLNYQQARSVRKAKFSDILLDQLAQSDRSVLGAVGKTISMKGQARIKGIKEKFDPLNIVRFMTMGSRFGPALFGKMTGRNQKDIDYFTGRTKSVVGTRNTADRLKKVGGDGDSEGINQQLAKIFSFLQNNREEDIKLKQLAKNSEEEIALEKGKRHKELLDTLQKLMKHINSGGKMTAEPVKETSMFDSIWNNIKGLAEMMGEMRKFMFDMAKRIGMPISKSLLSAGKFGLRMLPIVASAAVVGTAILGADYLAREYLGVGKNADGTDIVIDEKQDEENWNKMDAAEKFESSIARAIEQAGDILSPGAVLEARAARIKNETEYLKKKEQGTATRVEPEAPEDMMFDPEGNLTPLPPNKYQSSPVTMPVKPAVVPQAPANMEFDAEGKLIPSPVQIKPVPVPAVPKSAPVSSLSNTNSDLNLPKPAASNDMKPIINKTVNNLSQKQERTGLRPSQISVRNDEPTFMQLIIASTRVV